MQEYINLINFLKENNESVRKDLEKLRFGTIVWGYISDIGYDPNGGNGSGYGGEDIYRRMIYVNEDYSIPLDKELFLHLEANDGVDEDGNDKYKEVIVETGYYEGIEDEDWNRCLECKDKDKLKIIGNNLDYHHIMMYCEKKKIKYSIFGVGYILFKKRGKRIFLLHFDNTKPLHEQKSEVYKALLDYFIGLQ